MHSFCNCIGLEKSLRIAAERKSLGNLQQKFWVGQYFKSKLFSVRKIEKNKVFYIDFDFNPRLKGFSTLESQHCNLER